ncbi:MAG: hypothetical protein ACTSXD_11820 [Candidatus Heimdallarchaeaceae archaeon]
MLFSTFPREVGPPRKVVTDMKQFLDYINLYNGKRKALYTSIYMFKNINEEWKPDYNSAIVDKLYFDFDDKSCNAWEECNRLHQTCFEQNLKHIVVFSGRGYHLYIFTTHYNPTYKKEAIRGGQTYFIDKLNLTVDRQVLGNVAQLARIPNTYHSKAKRFCIPLTKEQFEKGDKFIKHLAKEQNFVKDIIIGEKLFDLKRFDIKKEPEFNLNLPEITSKSFNTTSITRDLPPCILNILNKEIKRWKDRYLIILYFKEKGYTREEVLEILKKYLTKQKLYHCIKEERQLQYLFERDDLVFPSCKRMKEDGFCPGKCKFYEKVIYR